MRHEEMREMKRKDEGEKKGKVTKTKWGKYNGHGSDLCSSLLLSLFSPFFHAILEVDITTPNDWHVG